MSLASSAVTKLVSLGIGLSVTIFGASYFWYNYFVKPRIIPKKWRRVGTLVQLNLFPVKSCAPLKLAPDTEAICEELCMRVDDIRDRGFMLLDDDCQMITARIYPKMVLIGMKQLGRTKLSISSPNMEDTLELDLATLAEEAPGKDVRTAVWGTSLDAMLCGEKYDRWFSKAILNEETGLHLVYYPHQKPVRTVNARMTKEPYITKKDTGTFNDATSYMLMNLSSIDDLNARIPRPVNALQFRGNFHLKMDHDEPYAEDNWGWVRIGEDAIFRVVAPCTRCILPNINVITGERDPDGEPLKTLNIYRKWKNYASPSLGIHLGVRQPGNVKLHDVIYVEDTEPTVSKA